MSTPAPDPSPKAASNTPPSDAQELDTTGQSAKKSKELVDLILINETNGLPIQFASWPIRVIGTRKKAMKEVKKEMKKMKTYEKKKNKEHQKDSSSSSSSSSDSGSESDSGGEDEETDEYALGSHAGRSWDVPTLPAPGTISTAPSVLLGRILPPKKRLRNFIGLGNKTRTSRGYIYVDVVHPDGYKLHLQIYVRLGTGEGEVKHEGDGKEKGKPTKTRKAPSLEALFVGPVDLDSKARSPEPMGSGKFEEGKIFKVEMVETQDSRKPQPRPDPGSPVVTSRGNSEAVPFATTIANPSIENPTPSRFSIQIHFLSPIQNLTNGPLNDATAKASALRPGKGLEAATYVSHEASRTSLRIGEEARWHEFDKVDFLKDIKDEKENGSGDGIANRGSRLNKIRHSLHELEGLKKKFVGVWVHNGGNPVFQGHVKINPVDGVAYGPRFSNTFETTAVFAEDSVLCYGFHDAGGGRHDQVYVYVTPLYENWLGELIKENRKWLETSFSTLALAGAHDSGMFMPSIDPGLEKFITSGSLPDALAAKGVVDVSTPVVHLLVNMLEKGGLELERVINNIANTQKDHFPSQLKMGVRFFDFRPGYCFYDVVKKKKGKIHHQHAIVPGCEYITFLTDVLTFLATHPAEIVFTEIKNSGFVLKKDKIKDDEVVALAMTPTVDELAACLVEARSKAPKEAEKILVGNEYDLDSPIGELLKEGKRFVIVDKMHSGDQAWPKVDSYDHHAYNTDDPASIIAQLNLTHEKSLHFEENQRKTDGASAPGIATQDEAKKQDAPAKLAESPTGEPAPASAPPAPPAPESAKPKRGALYQLQATPTSNVKDDIFASITFSNSSSLLTYMKAIADRATYPWIAKNNFSEPGTVVFLNDFVDGVLVEHAIEKSRERAGL